MRFRIDTRDGYVRIRDPRQMQECVCSKNHSGMWLCHTKGYCENNPVITGVREGFKAAEVKTARQQLETLGQLQDMKAYADRVKKIEKWLIPAIATFMAVVGAVSQQWFLLSVSVPTLMGGYYLGKLMRRL